MLEKELAYLGSMCAAALMKKDLALPIGKEKVDQNNCWCCLKSKCSVCPLAGN